MKLSKTFPQKLKDKEAVPIFSLPSSLGREISLWECKQKQNLVIVFYHGPKCTICQKKSKEYAELYEKAKDLEAKIPAVSFDTIDHLKEFLQRVPLPFPLLSDVEGKVTEMYTNKDEGRKAPFPSIFITDRFGDLYHQQIANEANKLPAGKEVLDWLLFMDIQCPECSHL